MSVPSIGNPLGPTGQALLGLIDASTFWTERCLKGFPAKAKRLKWRTHMWDACEILDELTYGHYLMAGSTFGGALEDVEDFDYSTSFSQAVKRFHKAQAWLRDTLLRQSERGLRKLVPFIYGEPMPAAQVFNICLLHLCYHVGQLSLIRQAADPNWDIWLSD